MGGLKACPPVAVLAELGDRSLFRPGLIPGERDDVREGHFAASKPTRVQAMAMAAAMRDSPAMKPEAMGTL